MRSEAKHPVSLVLSGGGARAAYQVGVVKALAERFPNLPFQIITGSSAGSLNAVVLGLHAPNFRKGAEHLVQIWANLSTEQVYEAKVLPLTWGLIKGIVQFLGGGSSLVAEQRGLFDSAPLAALIRRNMDFEKLNKNLEFGSLQALGITATGYSVPFTTTFCGGTRVRPWVRPSRVGLKAQLGPEHLMASTSLPFLFPPVRIGTAWFGDGSMRQTHPLAPSIHLGARKILAIGLRKKSEPQISALEERFPPPTLAQVLGTIFNGIFLDGFEADGRHLALINRVLERVPQELPTGTMDLPTDHTLRPVALHVISPSQDLGKLALSFLDRPPWTIKLLMRGLGHSRMKTADFASYLLFEGAFAGKLMEIGFQDACDQMDRIEAFLA